MPVRSYQERKGFILRPKFIFIDGRTGATHYSETFNEQGLYNAAAEHAGPVLVLRADGQLDSELPERAQHAEGARLAGPAQVAALATRRALELASPLRQRSC